MNSKLDIKFEFTIKSILYVVATSSTYNYSHEHEKTLDRNPIYRNNYSV